MTRSFTLLFLLCASTGAQAFCGFYVARADTSLYNQASQVVLVRDGERSVITMASDFQGEVDEFAMVVPVPTVLEREQINVNDQALIDHLDAYTAPRLVEYHDDDPCRREVLMSRMAEAPAAVQESAGVLQDRDLGVTIEATYTVGEYDILILSASQSDGLVTWLSDNGYRMPPGAEPVVGSYLRQGMKFFVAKVNLDEQARLGYNNLRPLQIAFESRRFMLPIRLGTVNAAGPQELFVYALTRSGRVETSNYRTVELPTGMDLPVYVKSEFGEFYRSLFRRQTERENRRAVFLEYAWDMAWCDPCAADPLSQAELRELGVFWLDPNQANAPAQDVFVTRLHLSYDREHFPEDLMFQTTGNRENFQGRYVLRHPWRGAPRCAAARRYLSHELPERRRRAAENLARLTGWDLNDIREKMRLVQAEPQDSGDGQRPWWRALWPDSGR